jgi:PPOX class probable F420-dependent enzyme
MASLDDDGVRELLAQPNYAVISTLNANGSIHNTVVWIDAEDGAVAVNSAVGRLWPTNLQRDPRIGVLVFKAGDPYHFVEIRGTVKSSLENADEHIDRLAKKYLGVDEFPGRRAGEQRIKFVIEPEHVRYVHQS